MKKFYVGVKAIIKDDQKGYLMLRHSSGWLDIPGGRMDDNEDFKETLERELAEELPGTKLIEVRKLVDSKRVMKDIDTDVSLVLLYYTVKVQLPKDIKISDEHTGYMWINDIDDVAEEDRASENVKVIEKLLA